MEFLIMILARDRFQHLLSSGDAARAFLSLSNSLFFIFFKKKERIGVYLCVAE